MQTIITKYLPATNTKGRRIKATEQRNNNSVTINIHGLWLAEAHRKAVEVLQKQSGTNLKYVAGEMKNGYVFVAID